jgi:hypothetical protein
MSMVHGRYDIQVFQLGKLVVHSLDDLLQSRSRHFKVYVPYAITMLESQHDFSFIFGGEIVIIVIVKYDEWKRRGIF